MQNDRLLSALKHMAVADAIGDPFEFQTAPKKKDLLQLIAATSPLRITDDTQMTLFGFEGLYLAGQSLGDGYRPLDALPYIAQAYLRWLHTQSSGYPREGYQTGLLSYPCMFRVAAPGNTCLSSLRHFGKTGSVCGNDSKGCGAVMRTLPFAQFDSADLARAAGSLTHGHSQSELYVMLLHTYMRSLMGGVAPQLTKGMSFAEVFGDGGWTAKPCVEIAIWSVEHCGGDFNKMLELSILHSGDSDSTAAVAGALFGLKFGGEPAAYSRLVERPAIDYVVSFL